MEGKFLVKHIVIFVYLGTVHGGAQALLPALCSGITPVSIQGLYGVQELNKVQSHAKQAL